MNALVVTILFVGAVVVMATSDVLPCKIVDTAKVRAMETELQTLRSQVAERKQAAEAAANKGAWMWHREPGALDRGAYNEKRHVSSSPSVYGN